MSVMQETYRELIHRIRVRRARRRVVERIARY